MVLYTIPQKVPSDDLVLGMLTYPLIESLPLRSASRATYSGSPDPLLDNQTNGKSADICCGLGHACIARIPQTLNNQLQNPLNNTL